MKMTDNTFVVDKQDSVDDCFANFDLNINESVDFFIVGAGNFSLKIFNRLAKYYKPIIIAADGGYDTLIKNSIRPNIFIGDMDSVYKKPKNIKKIILPKEKDDTDMHSCIKFAIKNGAKSIRVFGGIGGRIDHTIANFQSLFYCFNKKINAIMYGGGFRSFFINSKYKFTNINLDDLQLKTTNWHEYYYKKKSKISIFAWDKIVKGVTIKGLKYEINNIDLNNEFPVGISNEFIGNDFYIDIKKGTLLIQEELNIT